MQAQEIEPIVIGANEHIDAFGACLNEESTQSLVNTAKTIGTSALQFKYLAELQVCQVVQNANVVVDRLIEMYIDDLGIDEPHIMWEVELRILNWNGTSVRVWALMNRPVIKSAKGSI